MCTTLEHNFFKMLEGYTPTQIAMCMAQAWVESGGFNKTEENLNYTTAERILQVFPSHFKDLADASSCVNRPDLLANRVYANRMGNGDEASGDGYKYRGRGLIQITGKHNYDAYQDYVGGVLPLDIVKLPASAVWYLTKYCHKFMYYAGIGDVETCTRLVNGGLNGLPERQAKYEYYRKLLNGQ